MPSLEKWLKDHEKKDQEAFQSIHDHLDRLDKATNNDLIVYKIDELKNQFVLLEDKIDSNFVTKTEFAPVQRIVYGMVALILASVIGAVLTLIVRS